MACLFGSRSQISDLRNFESFEAGSFDWKVGHSAALAHFNVSQGLRRRGCLNLTSYLGERQ